MVSGLLRKFGRRLPKSVKDGLRPAHFVIADLERQARYYARRAKPDSVLETKYGFDLAVDTSDFVQRRHLTNEGTHEKRMTRFLYEKMSDVEGDFLDIGANVGFYSLMFCANNSGTAFAFEPLSYNVGKISENAALNRLTRDIEIYAIGLSDTTGSVTIHYDPANRGAANELANETRLEVFKRSEHCEFERLDEVEGLSDDIGLVKIDVEGHEIEVLEGGSETFGELQPDLLIETHPPQLKKKGKSLGDLLSILSDYGYRLIYLIQDERELTVEEAKQSPDRIERNHGFWCEA